MENTGKKKVNNYIASSAGMVRSGKYDHWFFFSLLFFVSALYFFFFGNQIFFYQENQALFIYTGDYFNQFAIKPGGLLQYAGNFIVQGYHNPISGCLILSALITSVAVVFYNISRKIYSGGPLLMLFMVLPACMLILFNSDFNFLTCYTLGFLLVSIWFLILIKAEKNCAVFFLLALFPLFYYITGAYAWIIAGMYVIYSLMNKKIIYPAFIIILALITIAVFKKIIFLQPLNELLISPLPPKDLFRHPALIYMFCGLFVIYPLLLKTASLIKVKEADTRSFSTYAVIFVFSLTIFLLSRLYNPEYEKLFRLEKMFYGQQWDEVIKFQEKAQVKNVIAQYYYNIALSEKDLLCDRLFNCSYNFGTNSIMMQWDSKVNINQIFRGAYFFYTIGLVNEAHRWAFESMVVQGFRPENIKMLIKTELINGHYRIAEKYIDVLKRTLNYRSFAKKYEKYLDDNDLIATDPELGGKVKLLPAKDFYIRLKDQQDNVMLLLQDNPGNRKAFEYMIAWFMLERNFEYVCDEIVKMKGMGYNSIPRHIEETALWFRTYTGKLPDLGGLTISNGTMKRFSEFQSAASQVVPGGEKFRKTFGNTFWYYMEF